MLSIGRLVASGKLKLLMMDDMKGFGRTMANHPGDVYDHEHRVWNRTSKHERCPTIPILLPIVDKENRHHLIHQTMLHWPQKPKLKRQQTVVVP